MTNNTSPSAVERLEPLRAIAELKVRPFDGFPDDWVEQIAACAECQRYKDHSIQQGICDEHRRPIWAREKHDAHEEVALFYRAREIARNAIFEAEKGTAPLPGVAARLERALRDADARGLEGDDLIMVASDFLVAAENHDEQPLWLCLGDLRLLLSALKARPGVEEVARVVDPLAFGDLVEGHVTIHRPAETRDERRAGARAKAQAILALFPASVGGEGLGSSPELPCAETGTHIPSSPVAWRVKDFADGWILCHSEAEARREAESAGNLVQPLYLKEDAADV